MKQKRNKGITLVGFLLLMIAFIFIVIAIVLALKGEDGLIHTSKTTSIAKDKKEIESIAKLAYSSEIIATSINGNYLRLHHILNKVKESGYEIVEVSVTDKNAKILKVLLDKEKLTIKPEEKQEIQLTINKEDKKNTYYFVKSKNAYFEISLTSNSVIVGDGISSQELEALSKDNDEIVLDVKGSSAKAEVKDKTINITGIQPGNTLIDVIINGTKYSTITVEVID